MALGSTLPSQYRPANRSATPPRPKPPISGGNSPSGTAPKPQVTYAPIPPYFVPPAAGYSENMPGIPNTNGTPNPFINMPSGLPTAESVAGQRAADELAAQYQSQSDAMFAQRKSDFEYDKLLANSMTGVNNKALTNATANSLALNNESMFRNSLDSRSNAIDAKFITDTWGLSNEQKILDDANVQRLIGQVEEGYGFANRQFDLANQATDLQQGINTRAAVSDATGRGAMLSAGFMDNLSDIKTQADISRGRAVLDQSQAFSGITGNIGDLKNRQANTDIAYRNSVLGFQQQLDNNSLAKSAIDSMAREYGIRAKDMQQSLAVAIEKNNLDNAQVIGQLSQAYQSGNAQQIAQMNQFLATLIGA